MKKIMTLCAVAIYCLAQPVLAQKDAKAKAILDKMSKKISTFKTVKANFALHLMGSNGKITDTKKGSFAMKGQKYHVTLPGQDIICDSKTIWTYSKDAKEVQVNSFNPNEQTLSPAKLFTNFYDKEYNYHYIGAKKVQGKNCDIIEMTPIANDKQFSKIDLSIDKTTGIIAGGNIWEKSGNQYQYDISNFKSNADIPDSYFTFDPKAHPGVEVVDLR